MKLPAPALFRRRLRWLGLATLLFVFTAALTLTGIGGIPTRADDADVPAAPTGLRVDPESGSLDVSLAWNDVDGASRYWVRWRVADPGHKLNEGVEVRSSEADITVAASGEWVVRVQACNDAGCGSPLAKQFTVEPVPEPTATPAPTATPTPEPTATPTPLPLQVSVTADSTTPRTGQAAKLQSAITNPPPGETPSYQWEMELHGRWQPALAQGDSTFSVTVSNPMSVRFRVTVAYASGASATSDPVTVTWLAPPPTPTPEPTATPTPLPLQVSITADSASPQTGQAAELRAAIVNPRSGEMPSYQWEMELNGRWQPAPSQGGSTYSVSVSNPMSVGFRVTVAYASGASATSDPVTVTWLAPPPTPTPEPTATPTPLPLQVSVTADPASPRTGQAAELRTAIVNPRSGETPSYHWEMELDGRWQPSLAQGGSIYSVAVSNAMSVRFRVTVSYASGASATSDPVTVTWLAPPPTPTPTPVSLQVSVTADPAQPQVGEAVELRAVITNPPSGKTPCIQLGDGNWRPLAYPGAGRHLLLSHHDIRNPAVPGHGLLRVRGFGHVGSRHRDVARPAPHADTNPGTTPRPTRQPARSRPQPTRWTWRWIGTMWPEPPTTGCAGAWPGPGTR